MKTAKSFFTEDQLKAAKAEFKIRTKLKAEGWAGLSKRGALVDRRQDPNSTPILKNTFLGFGIPKTKDELKTALSNGTE